jgi:enolase-phosphatase E1
VPRLTRLLPVFCNRTGHIWTSGYETGAYAAPLYPDVLPFFRRVHASSPAVTGQGGDGGRLRRLLAIYSSGSVHAQRLLLAHVLADESSEGKGEGNSKGSVDITEMFEAEEGEGTRLFDTVNAGPKTEASSYNKIAGALGKGPAEVVFFTDNVAGE